MESVNGVVLAPKHGPRLAIIYGLTAFLYQRDGEIIAFARPDLAVSGMGSLSVAPVVDIRAMSAA